MKIFKRRSRNASELSKANTRPEQIDAKNSKMESTNTFSKVLASKKTESKNQEIFSLVSSLDQLSTQFQKHPTIQMYTRYKNHLKRIIEIAVPQATGINRSFSRPTIKNPKSKEFHTLNIINSEMDSLLKMIKAKEKDRLSLISKVVRIKGLIIDLIQ